MLPAAVTADLDGLIHALRQQPSMGGTIGFAGVGDDFLVAVRVLGEDVSVFLSDLTAAVDYPLARQVLEDLDIPVPSDDDLDQVLPAGDMSIFADLGLDEMELGAVSADLDLYPEDAVASIAERLRFGHVVERALESRSARDRVHRVLRARDAARAGRGGGGRAGWPAGRGRTG